MYGIPLTVLQNQVWQPCFAPKNDSIYPLNSTAATWALFELAKNKDTQTRLRNELMTLDTENPSMDELNSLRFLDCVVRETQRAHAPVAVTSAHRKLSALLPV